MRKFFLIPLMACAMLFSNAAFAVNVSDLAELKAALANGGNITLTANITASEELAIVKATTLDGAGFAIKNTNTDVLSIYTGENVVIKNITLYAANSDNGRAIGVETATSNLTVDNIVANCNRRGITYYADANDNCTLNILNSTIQYVKKNTSASSITLRTATVDAWGNPQNIDYDECAPGKDGRGISLWEMKHTTVVIDNSTIQGFDYDVNCGPSSAYGDNDYTGTTITATNSTFKGRCAYNVHVGNAKFEFTDCTITGVNVFKGSQESFACFVMDATSNHCLLTINGGSIATARFNANSEANNNAREFMVTNRGTNNEIIINNAQYTCPKDLGDNKGGIVEYMNTGKVEINGGIYDCPQIVQGFFVSEGAEIVINGGNFNITTVSATDGEYEPLEDVDTYHGINVNGGTFNLDLAEVHPTGDETTTIIASGSKTVTNANGTTSVVPTATEKVDMAAGEWGETDENSNVVIAEGTVTLDGDAEAYRVDMKENTVLVVEAGTTLTIGEGGVALDNSTVNKPQILVEAGATLIINGLMYGSVTDNLVVEASEDAQGVLLINPEVQAHGDNHPNGTFRLTSKAYKKGTGNFVHQRFGMPTYNNTVRMDYENKESTTITRVTNWDYTADYWKTDAEGKVVWTQFDNAGINLTSDGVFTCYDIVSNNAKEETMAYLFTGELMGNSNADLTFRRGYNPYANSYTAPVNIKALLDDIKVKYGNIDATVYLYKSLANDNFTWLPVTLSDYEFDTPDDTEIAPMQAFLLNLPNGDNAKAQINYADNVYDPIVNPASSAPVRRAAANNSLLKLTVADADNNSCDRLMMIEDNRFDNDFNNGYDARQYMDQGISLYATTEDERYSTIATDDLSNCYIGFNAQEAGQYTITVAANGMDYNMLDMLTGEVYNLNEGNIISFAAEQGQNDRRFRIIGRRNVVTDMEDVEAVNNAEKQMRDGNLYILRNGHVYDAQGQIVK